MFRKYRLTACLEIPNCAAVTLAMSPGWSGRLWTMNSSTRCRSSLFNPNRRPLTLSIYSYPYCKLNCRLSQHNDVTFTSEAVKNWVQPRFLLIPAEAGIQGNLRIRTPVFTGVTTKSSSFTPSSLPRPRPSRGFPARRPRQQIEEHLPHLPVVPCASFRALSFSTCSFCCSTSRCVCFTSISIILTCIWGAAARAAPARALLGRHKGGRHGPLDPLRDLLRPEESPGTCKSGRPLPS